VQHYLRYVDSTRGYEPWEVDDGFACRFGETETGLNYHRVAPGEHMLETLERVTGWNVSATFHELELPIDHFYPRIGRPCMGSDDHLSSPSLQLDRPLVASSRSQLIALKRKLEEICLTVQPEPANLAVFGNEIRNLLILSCTEVEAMWRGVLGANGSTVKQPTTQHYWQLLKVLRLDEYAVEFPDYPWLAPVRPFAGWDRDKATASLAWYAAYNGVKHDREREFARATLENAFAAVTACAVMAVAQFTINGFFGKRGELAAFFRFAQLPRWDVGESYVGIPTPQQSVSHPALR